jgi:hypothetical protein
MGVNTFSKENYLEAAQLFHWAVREHYVAWFTGRFERHRRTEVMLPRLVKKGKLVAVRYGNHLVYSTPRRKSGLIDHGLGCTEGLVRVWRSRMDGAIIPERFFRGYGSVPEWGIWYPPGKLLLYEYSSQNNFEQARIVKTKITKYQTNLPELKNYFAAEKATVLFVIDITRERVKNFIDREKPDGPFFFTDYETFKNVPLGEQLNAPIYFWGDDGKEYSITACST